MNVYDDKTIETVRTCSVSCRVVSCRVVSCRVVRKLRRSCTRPGLTCFQQLSMASTVEWNVSSVMALISSAAEALAADSAPERGRGFVSVGGRSE
jgi:hypothetical protein